ncbi:recombination protein NinB [Acinetobacter puyangensis]|uniref:recombination protein NinB n=1 Tax=Acinetobacter puyangensis TaxID=1096779 RepID=UPI003A4D7245
MELKQTFVIKSFSDVMKVHSYLGQHHGKAAYESKPLVVKVGQKEEERSLAQNRLYWKWLQQWSKHQGTDKDSEHLFFKRQFLISIFNRDDPEFAEMCAAIKALKENEIAEYQAIADQVIKLTSTTKASVKQMTEYLELIDAFCLKHGVKLVTPEDLMWCYEN